jgi:hypothetical protein
VNGGYAACLRRVAGNFSSGLPDDLIVSHLNGVIVVACTIVKRWSEIMHTMTSNYTIHTLNTMAVSGRSIDQSHLLCASSCSQLFVQSNCGANQLDF